MKMIYGYVKKKAWSTEKENAVFLFCNTLFFMAVGTLCWLLAGRWVWNEVEGLVCFIGYPAIFWGLIGGILFLFRQDT